MLVRIQLLRLLLFFFEKVSHSKVEIIVKDFRKVSGDENPENEILDETYSSMEV